jgi:hypothetical protein
MSSEAISFGEGHNAAQQADLTSESLHLLASQQPNEAERAEHGLWP